jgi:hypothetical protein
MNEQFRKLLVQARELADEVFDYDGSDYAEIVQEKFAELIVRECAEVVYSRSGHATPQDLYEHFGVEE